MYQILDDVKPLSKRLQVKPLNEGEVALFRLVRAFKKTQDREDPTCPEVAIYPGVEQINDPFEATNNTKSKKMGTRIEGYKEGRSGSQATPVYERVVFIRGEKRVGFDNPAMYEFMMRSKHSGANRYRKQMGAKNPAMWILVGADQVKDLLAIEDLKFHAESMLRKSDSTGLKTIAMKLNSSPDPRLHVSAYKPGMPDDIYAIKLALFQKAKEYPKQVLYACDDTTSKKRVEAYDALTMAVMYVNERGGYTIYSVDDKEEEIFSPDPGKDAFESLISFFESEKGATAYVKFAAALKRAQKIPA